MSIFHQQKDSREFLITMLPVLGFWMIITFPSTPFTLLGLKNIIQHFLVGVLLATVVTSICPYPLLTRKECDRYLHFTTILRFKVYIFRLCIDMIKSGIDVAKRVLRRNLLISPGIVEVETPLSDDLEIALNANSITLTPGTITIDAHKIPQGSRFLVHCISQEAVQDILKNGGFVKRIQDCLRRD